MTINEAYGLNEEIEIKIAYKHPKSFMGMIIYEDWIVVDTMKDALRVLAGGKGYNDLWDKYISLSDNEIALAVDGDEIKETIVNDGVLYAIIGNTQYLYDIKNDEVKGVRV